MFSYYGSKSKIIKKYPKPKYDVIVEPFAGSARYALEYWEKDVYLYEVNETVYSVWEYLLQASKKDILSLPDVTSKTKLSTIDGFSSLPDGAKSLIGFCSNQGSAMPKNYSGQFNGWNRNKLQIAENIHKIKHWKVFNQDYRESSVLQNGQNITWYIDPPYQNKGKWYKYNKIDYLELGKFCKSLTGQIIVCEGEDADWLEFSYLTDVSGQLRKSKEMIWYKE